MDSKLLFFSPLFFCDVTNLHLFFISFYFFVQLDIPGVYKMKLWAGRNYTVECRQNPSSE